MLAEEEDVTVTGEFEQAEVAADYLSQHETDLLFLDVQMPVMDGFALLETLPEERMPVVVFTTAHDEHAVRAFEVHAFDYLLKPFDDERFARTLGRARKYLRSQTDNSDRLLGLLDELRQARQEPARFAIRAPGRVFFVRVDEIDWVEAADNYASLHVGHDTHLVRETMNSLEARLDAKRFLRIHRSTIVNAERIRELRPWFHGEYMVILKDGTELTLSRTYREKILAVLGT